MRASCCKDFLEHVKPFAVTMEKTEKCYIRQDKNNSYLIEI